MKLQNNNYLVSSRVLAQVIEALAAHHTSRTADEDEENNEDVIAAQSALESEIKIKSSTPPLSTTPTQAAHAAAPDLLAALRAIADHAWEAQTEMPDGSAKRDVVRCLNLARAAIAKATGGAE